MTAEIRSMIPPEKPVLQKKGGEIMPSDAQKKTRNKWDLKNMSTLACRIDRDFAEYFRIYAENRDTNVNTLLANYVLGCIGEKERGKSPAPAQKKQEEKEEENEKRLGTHTTLGCRLRREQADRFREYAAQRDRTVSALLYGYINSCIRDNWAEIAAYLHLPKEDGEN